MHKAILVIQFYQDSDRSRDMRQEVIGFENATPIEQKE